MVQFYEKRDQDVREDYEPSSVHHKTLQHNEKR